MQLGSLGMVSPKHGEWGRSPVTAQGTACQAGSSVHEGPGDLRHRGTIHKLKACSPGAGVGVQLGQPSSGA